MLETPLLAQMVTSLIVPAIPYLLKGGEQAWTEASKKIGTDTWEWAKTIWTNLVSYSKSKSNGEETVKEVLKAAQELADNPADPDAEVVLRVQIKKLLASDPELSLEIEKALNEAEKSGVPTSIRVGGVDISGGANVTNSGNLVGGNQTFTNQK